MPIYAYALRTLSLVSWTLARCCCQGHFKSRS